MLPKFSSLTSCSADMFARFLSSQDTFTAAFRRKRKSRCLSRVHMTNTVNDVDNLIARHHEYFPSAKCASLGISKQMQQICQGEAEVHPASARSTPSASMYCCVSTGSSMDHVLRILGLMRCHKYNKAHDPTKICQAIDAFNPSKGLCAVSDSAARMMLRYWV
jgi:hypothetical protein